MTVAELIAELQKLPKAVPVRIVYDSAVMCVDIKMVKLWFPEAYMAEDESGLGCIGLFDDGSADEITSDPYDKRLPR